MQFDLSETTEEIVPLGLRADGTPFWGYHGAEGEEGGEESEEENEDEENETGDGLTPGGRKAIEAERAAAKAARDALRPWRVLAKELGVTSPDEVRAALAAKTDKAEKKQDEVDVRQVQREILDKANTRIVNAEIRALAADKFADPRDAVKFLNAGDYDVDEDGEVDSRSIERDLSDLLREKPHLAKVSRRVDFEGGVRGPTSGKPRSMNDIIRDAAGRGRR
jgi:hypothetical protein